MNLRKPSFALRKTLPKIELICIDRFRGIKRFTGLGQLTPAQLASLWPKRKRVGRRQLALGARAWAALRALTPEPLEALLKSDLRELPFLKAALQRHLQELPWTTDGLSLTERQALAALAKGPRTAGQLFADAQLKTDPLPFMGDLFFWSVMRDLIEAPRPPVAVSAATRRVAWHRRVLRLTPTGRCWTASSTGRGSSRWRAGSAAFRQGRAHRTGAGIPRAGRRLGWSDPSAELAEALLGRAAKQRHVSVGGDERIAHRLAAERHRGAAGPVEAVAVGMVAVGLPDGHADGGQPAENAA